MFQPQVKLEFVRHYAPPRKGWIVYVDIDPSEEGKTGGHSISLEAKQCREQMQREGEIVRAELEALGAQVGGSRQKWREKFDLPAIPGDRDIVAFHPKTRRCLIIEAEGNSRAQPEQKLYKAIGQLVMAAGSAKPPGWDVNLVLVAFGDKMGEHLRKASVLPQIGIYALNITDAGVPNHRWVFGPPPLLKS